MKSRRGYMYGLVQAARSATSLVQRWFSESIRFGCKWGEFAIIMPQFTVSGAFR